MRSDEWTMDLIDEMFADDLPDGPATHQSVEDRLGARPQHVGQVFDVVKKVASNRVHGAAPTALPAVSRGGVAALWRLAGPLVCEVPHTSTPFQEDEETT